MTDKKTNDNFLLLPNNLVWDVKGKKNTLIKKYGDKIVHVLPYLIGTTNYMGKTIFSLNELIITCGLTPKAGKNKTTEQFKNLLITLERDRIIQQTNQDIKKIKLNNYIKCEINIPILKNKDGENREFFTITYNDYLKIMDEYNGSLDKITLLKVYFYINARIFRRYIFEYTDEETGEIEKFSQNILVHGGKAQCFYDTYKNICTDLDISKNTFKEYIDELQDLKLIFYGHIGKVQDNFNGIQEANNVYCVDINELEEALKASRLFYETNGYKVLGKKYNKQQRKMNGLKGKIKQMKNKGQDTSSLENKLSKIEEKLESKTIPLKNHKKGEGFQTKNQVPESVRITQELQEENIDEVLNEDFVPNNIEELLDIKEECTNSDSAYNAMLQQFEEEMGNYKEVI